MINNDDLFLKGIHEILFSSLNLDYVLFFSFLRQPILLKLWKPQTSSIPIVVDCTGIEPFIRIFQNTSWYILKTSIV